MEVQKIKRHIGKKVFVILNNNYQYTFIVPDFEGTGFSIKDKFNEDIDIECSFISFMKEVKK